MSAWTASAQSADAVGEAHASAIKLSHVAEFEPASIDGGAGVHRG